MFRGFLEHCNFNCSYCPFEFKSKASETEQDQRSLMKFTGWVSDNTCYSLSVFFTPWGEALIHPWYQRAITEISHMAHVQKVVIQTNLSCSLEWLDHCSAKKTALWCSFHPAEMSIPAFVDRCNQLRDRGIKFSAGVVGVKESFDIIEELREKLPDDIYLWVNAYKSQPNYYSDDDIRRLGSIDPLFHKNTVYHNSLGKLCRCGYSVISIQGDGTIRRCHFTDKPLGNLYSDKIEDLLFLQPCQNKTCGCHIGYVHMLENDADMIYGDRILERIPRAEFLTTA